MIVVAMREAKAKTSDFFLINSGTLQNNKRAICSLCAKDMAWLQRCSSKILEVSSLSKRYGSDEMGFNHIFHCISAYVSENVSILESGGGHKKRDG